MAQEGAEKNSALAQYISHATFWCLLLYELLCYPSCISKFALALLPHCSKDVKRLQTTWKSFIFLTKSHQLESVNAMATSQPSSQCISYLITKACFPGLHFRVDGADQLVLETAKPEHCQYQYLLCIGVFHRQSCLQEDLLPLRDESRSERTSEKIVQIPHDQ